MRLNLRTISNGLLLIFLGGVFLLLNYGFLDWNFWWNFLEFWPLVLILIGIGLVFNKRIPGSLALLVLGIFMVGMSFVRPAPDRPFLHIGPFSVDNTAPGNERRENATFPLDNGIEKGKVTINAGGAGLDLGSTSEGFSQGEVVSYYGQPGVKFDRQGDTLKLTLDSPKIKGISGRTKSDRFDVKLSESVPLDVTINGGAIAGKLNLSKLKLAKLDINVGAADVKVDFGATGQKTQANISCGASKITLAVPKEVGLKIHYSAPLSNLDFYRSDLTKEGNTYTSANYGTAASTIELRISGGAAKIQIVEPNQSL